MAGIEQHLNDPRTKNAAPEIGEDIEVMAVRHGERADITIAAALVGAHVRDANDYLAKKAPEKTKGSKIIAKSAPYGIPPVIVNPKIDAKLKEAVKQIFLGMAADPKGKAILDGIMVDKFIIPKDRDYDSVRDMEAWLKKNMPPAPEEAKK